MTRDVEAIRADLAARTVHGSASSAADRDIAALLGVIDGLRDKSCGLTLPGGVQVVAGVRCHHDQWVLCPGIPEECSRCRWTS